MQLTTSVQGCEEQVTGALGIGKVKVCQHIGLREDIAQTLDAFLFDDVT